MTYTYGKGSVRSTKLFQVLEASNYSWWTGGKTTENDIESWKNVL